MLSTKTWVSLSAGEQMKLNTLIVDALGIASAGSAAPGVAQMIKALGQLGGGDVRPMWTSERMNAPAAGLALSLLIHAWDFDDTHDEAVVHTASIAVSAAVSAAQLDETVTGENLLDGIAAGVQVLVRLSRWLGPTTGVIRTAGLGAVASAIAVATTLRFSYDEINSAAGLALTSTLSPSTRQAVVDSSLAKRLQPGLAVQTGVTAALLARGGVQGPADWLAGDYGLMAGREYAYEDLFAAPFEIDGVALKPYPACRYTHAALAAAHEVLPKASDTASIAKITVHVPKGEAYALVSRPFEDRGSPIIDAQFSIPWQVAAVAICGKYDLSVLHELGEGNDQVASFARRVTVVQDLPETASMAGATVEMVLYTGESYTEHALMPGSPENPLPWEQVASKTNSCLAVANVDSSAEAIRDFVLALPRATAKELRQQFRDFTETATFKEKE